MANHLGKGLDTSREDSEFHSIVLESVHSPVKLLNEYTGQYKKRLGSFSPLYLYRQITGHGATGYLCFRQWLEMAACVWPPATSPDTALLLAYRKDGLLLRQHLQEGKEPAIHLSNEVCGLFWQLPSAYFGSKSKHILYDRVQAILRSEGPIEDLRKRGSLKHARRQISHPEVPFSAESEANQFRMLVRETVHSPMQLLNEYTGQYKKKFGNHSSLVLYKKIVGPCTGYLSFRQWLELAAGVWPPDTSSDTALLLEYNKDRLLLRQHLLEGKAPAIYLTEEVCAHFWHLPSIYFGSRCKQMLHAKVQGILESEDAFQGKRRDRPCRRSITPQSEVLPGVLQATVIQEPQVQPAPIDDRGERIEQETSREDASNKSMWDLFRETIGEAKIKYEAQHKQARESRAQEFLHKLGPVIRAEKGGRRGGKRESL